MQTDGFLDRLDAGKQLAAHLEAYRESDAIVVGLARGGVVVAYSIADALDLPLRAFVVRKIGAPQNPELAIGAVSETGERWLDHQTIRATGATEAYIERESAAQVAEALRRQQAYGTRDHLSALEGKSVVLVDDGVATGSSALVALRSMRGVGVQSVLLAAPVASRPALDIVSEHADGTVFLLIPAPFLAVGFHYGRFDQVSDTEVKAYLARAERDRST